MCSRANRDLFNPYRVSKQALCYFSQDNVNNHLFTPDMAPRTDQSNNFSHRLRNNEVLGLVFCFWRGVTYGRGVTQLHHQKPYPAGIMIQKGCITLVQYPVSPPSSIYSTVYSPSQMQLEQNCMQPGLQVAGIWGVDLLTSPLPRHTHYTHTHSLLPWNVHRTHIVSVSCW